MGVNSKWNRAKWNAYRDREPPPDYLDNQPARGRTGANAPVGVDVEPTAHHPNPWKQAADRTFAAHGFTGRPTIREWAQHKATCEACP